MPEQAAPFSPVLPCLQLLPVLGTAAGRNESLCFLLACPELLCVGLESLHGSLSKSLPVPACNHYQLSRPFCHLSTAQHSTAQHSTAQRSTAQHDQPTAASQCFILWCLQILTGMFGTMVRRFQNHVDNVEARTANDTQNGCSADSGQGCYQNPFLSQQ